jgi:hypothetical protein
MKQIRKRHHYIPEFYLKGFTAPSSSLLWMYQKKINDIKTISPHNAAVISFYYSFKNDKGDMDHDTIENLMAEIEGEAAPIFKKIINKQILNESERRTFALFLSFIIVRVPNFRNNIEKSGAEKIKIMMKDIASNEDRFHLMFNDYLDRTGEIINIPFDELRNFALDESRYKISIKPIFSLALGLDIAMKLSNIIYNMKWDFLLGTNEHDFLTSDNPLVIHNPADHTGKPVGFLMKDIELSFPITNNIALLAYWSDDNFIRYRHPQTKGIKDINCRTVINARRFIFASKKLEGIKKLVLKYCDYFPKIEVIHKPPYIFTVNKPY